MYCTCIFGQDRLAAVGGARATALLLCTWAIWLCASFMCMYKYYRLREQIMEALKGMKTMFKDLTQKQSDALTRPLDKLLDSIT